VARPELRAIRGATVTERVDDRLMGPYGAWILLILFATGALGAVLAPITGLLTTLLFNMAL